MSEEVHSSVRSMLRSDGRGDARGAGRAAHRRGAARRALTPSGDDVFAVVATAGTTNLGTIDDLAGVAEVCGERGLWLHVDGAYGLGALCAPSVRDRFAGIERADSFIVDPHKWLFAPFDSCALIYREPASAAPPTASTPATSSRCTPTTPTGQPVRLRRPPHAPPARAAVLVLARRPRHRRLHGGGRAHADGHARGRRRDPRARGARARGRAGAVGDRLPPPRLGAGDYGRWAAGLRESGRAFVLPTTHEDEPVARLALVNPRTTLEDVEIVLDAMI